MSKSKLRKIENFAKQLTAGVIGHDYNHVNRVRRWAVLIAQEEGYGNLALVEAAALLHDIGKKFTKPGQKHGQVSARLAGKFLTENGFFSLDQIKEIQGAIASHDTGGRGGKNLSGILKDADILDLLGFVGAMRACLSKPNRPDCDLANPKGRTWGHSNKDFQAKFDRGRETGNYIIDQINFQISCWDNITHRTARLKAKPLVKFLRGCLKQLEREIWQKS